MNTLMDDFNESSIFRLKRNIMNLYNYFSRKLSSSVPPRLDSI